MAVPEPKPQRVVVPTPPSIVKRDQTFIAFIQFIGRAVNGGVEGADAIFQAKQIVNMLGLTVDELLEDVGHLVTLSGAGIDADNLGAFLEGIIADDLTIKDALQALETFVSDIGAGGSEDLFALTGVEVGARNLGNFTDGIIFNQSTTKEALQALSSYAAGLSRSIASAGSGKLYGDPSIIVDVNPNFYYSSQHTNGTEWKAERVNITPATSTPTVTTLTGPNPQPLTQIEFEALPW